MPLPTRGAGFLEKTALLVRPLLDDPLFDSRTHLGAQETLAPTLQQRMGQANTSGRAAFVGEKVEEVHPVAGGRAGRPRHHPHTPARPTAGERHYA